MTNPNKTLGFIWIVLLILAAWWLVTSDSADAAIDPTTGGVKLPTPATYGPAAPVDTSPPIDPTSGGVTLPTPVVYGPYTISDPSSLNSPQPPGAT